MNIQQIILGFLMKQSMTGYDIRQKFSLSFSFFSGISFGSIYPALTSMEKAELITTRQIIQTGAPNKKLCTITEKGKEEFVKHLRTPLPVDRYKNSFLMRMFFFDHLKPEEHLSFINEYLDTLTQTQKNLLEVQEQIEKHADPYQLLCFNSGKRQIQDLIENMQQTLKSLQTINKNKKEE